MEHDRERTLWRIAKMILDNLSGIAPEDELMRQTKIYRGLCTADAPLREIHAIVGGTARTESEQYISDVLTREGFVPKGPQVAFKRGDQVRIRNPDGSFTFGDITMSDAQGYSYVEVTIPVETSTTYTLTVPTSQIELRTCIPGDECGGVGCKCNP